MGWLGEDRYDAALEAETARFAEAVHDADPARPVPTCPEWTLAQLTGHVGQAQRWVTVVLERRAPVPNAQVPVRVPQDPDERSAWLVAGARRLGQAVREVGPQTEVWSWSQDHTAGFWLRRTTHDTLVHRRRGPGRRGLSGSAGPGSRPVPGRRRSRRSGWRCGSPG